MDFIADSSSRPSRIKWLASSRNKPEIEELLRTASSPGNINLELNSCHISRTVNAFIDFKILQFTGLKKHKVEMREKIRSCLYQKVNETFLWVALLCKKLETERIGNTLFVPEKIPPWLEPLYGRMMKQISENSEDFESCRHILSSLTLGYRPIHLRELIIPKIGRN